MCSSASNTLHCFITATFKYAESAELSKPDALPIQPAQCQRCENVGWDTNRHTVSSRSSRGEMLRLQFPSAGAGAV